MRGGEVGEEDMKGGDHTNDSIILLIGINH